MTYAWTEAFCFHMYEVTQNESDKVYISVLIYMLAVMLHLYTHVLNTSLR